MVQHFIQQMQSEFEMSIVGELTYFIGLQVKQMEDTIFISQSKYDESIINVFNIIFESVLFIFYFVLFNIISYLELFYFNCKLLYFRNKYLKDQVLEQKKG